MHVPTQMCSSIHCSTIQASRLHCTCHSDGNNTISSIGNKFVKFVIGKSAICCMVSKIEYLFFPVSSNVILKIGYIIVLSLISIQGVVQRPWDIIEECDWLICIFSDMLYKKGQPPGDVKWGISADLNNQLKLVFDRSADGRVMWLHEPHYFSGQLMGDECGVISCILFSGQLMLPCFHLWRQFIGVFAPRIWRGKSCFLQLE